MKKRNYSIGETAKIHGLTTQTLRFYDKINLFKPNYINPKTSYRYYSMGQFDKLRMINYLRSLEMPIEDIKKHFINEEEGPLLGFFQSELEKTKKKIKEFEEIKSKLSEEITLIKNKKNFNSVDIHYFKERILDFQILNTSNVEDMHKSFQTLKNRNHSLDQKRFGTIISESNLKKQKLQFHSTFMFIENEKYLTTIPYILEEGEYARIVSKGHREEQKLSLNMLLTWIKNNKYKIKGEALLILLSHNYHKENQIIYEIQIPVE